MTIVATDSAPRSVPWIAVVAVAVGAVFYIKLPTLASLATGFLFNALL